MNDRQIPHYLIRYKKGFASIQRNDDILVILYRLGTFSVENIHLVCTVGRYC